MLPYGNARSYGSSVTCQHGVRECETNMVEACGIKHLADPQHYMPFIFCVEQSADQKTPDALITSCAKDSATATAISTCYGEGSGTEGVAAIAEIAKETQPLGHQYTPWLVLNGQHSKQGEDNLKKAICDAYKGTNKPAACNTNDADHVVPKCFVNDTAVVV